jgi:diguanylate cyclase (GGDEF)-like protein/PAS domain S-box-containing protein
MTAWAAPVVHAPTVWTRRGGAGAKGRAALDKTTQVPLVSVRALLAGIDEIVIACSPDGTISFVAGAIVTLLGYAAEALEGRNVVEFIRPTDADEILNALLRWSGRMGAPPLDVHDVRASDGSWIPVRHEVLIGPDAQPFGEFVFVVTPLSTQGAARRVRRSSMVNQLRLQRLAAAVLHHGPDRFEENLDAAVAVLAGLDWVTRLSVWTAQPGHAVGPRTEVDLVRRAVWTARSNAPDRRLPDRLSSTSSVALRRLARLDEVHVRSVSDLSSRWQGERDWLTAAGVRSCLAVPMSIEGEFCGFVLVEATVSEIPPDGSMLATLRAAAAILAGAFRRHQAEVELSRQARTDALTGLANRWAFDQEVAGALLAGSGPVRSVAVAAINLDRFAVVNSVLGREAGNRVLVDAARRMSRAAQANDGLLARDQSDQFLLLMRGISRRPDAVAIVQRVLAAVAPPFDVDGRPVSIRGRAGLAFAPGSSGAAELVQCAELALRNPRQIGAFSIGVDDGGQRARVVRRLRRETELRTAIAGSQIEAYFQPELDLVDRRIIGAEALARWVHPVDGLLAPDEFIPVAEECGLIGDLGAQVFRAACRAVTGWDRASMPSPFELKVNLSALQLDADLPRMVDEVLSQTGLAADSLCFELTESALLTDPDAARSILGALRDRGIGLAIDDFGTGFSSMLYLKRLPITLLKIDRAFVTGLPADSDDRAIVGATVQLARHLAIDVTAEGVETEEQLDTLVALGCTRAQGYLLGRPQSAPSFAATLAAAR